MIDLKTMFPRGSKDFYEANPDTQLQSPKPKRDKAPALDTTNAGEKRSFPRITVRFTGYRVRPLDPDNFAGGCKDLLDSLRHASLIFGDEPWWIKFETTQEKVAHRTQEKTVIEIEYP